MSDAMPFITLVIPAYNEARRIRSTLEHALAFFSRQDYLWEVVVVDDGSKDNTVEVVQDTVGKAPVTILKNGVNRGKGYSVMRGVLAAKGKYVVFSDADESTPISEVHTLLRPLESGYDVAIGSRALDKDLVKVHQPWYRETMGRVFNLIVRLFVVQGFKDTQCGFKMFRCEPAKDIFPRQRIEGFSFDVESLYLAQKRGYSVIEVPVQWYNSPRSTVHPIKHSLQMFRDVLKIKTLDRQGVYETKKELHDGDR